MDPERILSALFDAATEWLSANGNNRMQSPLGMLPGGRTTPAANYREDDQQTGPGSPTAGELWWLLRGVPRLWLLDAGLALLARNGHRATLSADHLTASRAIAFPDRGGTFAMEEEFVFSGLNVDTVTIPAGAPVAKDPDTPNGIFLAGAADSTRPPVGLAQTAITVGFTGNVQTDRSLFLNDWSAVTGSPTLNPGRYLLDTTAGQLRTPPAPSGPGQLLADIGTAVAPDTLSIRIQINGRRAL